MIIERQPDSLVSLVLTDPSIMLDLKNHAGLPPDVSWTESDSLLARYMVAAENQVDKLTSQPYRQRTFTLTTTGLSRLHKPRQPKRHIYDILAGQYHFYGWELPIRPIIGTVSIAWTDDNGNTGTYVTGTDCKLYGAAALTPEIIFPVTFTPPPTVLTPYPYILTVTAGGTQDPVALIAMFEIATFYYRYPEAAAAGQLPPSQIFQANIDYLKGSFL